LQVLLIGAHLTPREKPPENPSNMCSIRRSIELFGGKTAVAFGISFYIVLCAVFFLVLHFAQLENISMCMGYVERGKGNFSIAWDWYWYEYDIVAAASFWHLAISK